MRWLNPLAFLGLLAIAIPVFVHLFGRRVARRVRFPSLRLLRLATPSASSRSQPTDILLLVVRCAIVVAAALALAQPFWSTPDRTARRALPVRAIIIDTSLSMSRLTSDGSPAVQRAWAVARAQRDSAREGIVIETARPASNIAAAASWLESRSGTRQLVILSDFQVGTLQEGDLARVPAGIGIQPVRVEVVGQDSSARLGPLAGVGILLQPRETEATWLGGSDGIEPPVKILSSPDDSLAVRASVVAIRQLVPGLQIGDSIEVVFPGHVGIAELVRQSALLQQPWQGDFLLALAAHPLMADAERSQPGPDCGGAPAAPIRNSRGDVVANVATRTDRPAQVLVFSCASAGTPGGTALLAAVGAAASPSLAVPEADPSLLPDEMLERWTRPPTDVNPEGVEETSPDGRWIWVVAVILLLIEEWIRRRMPRRVVSAPIIEQHQRVA